MAQQEGNTFIVRAKNGFWEKSKKAPLSEHFSTHLFDVKKIATEQTFLNRGDNRNLHFIFSMDLHTFFSAWRTYVKHVKCASCLANRWHSIDDEDWETCSMCEDEGWVGWDASKSLMLGSP